MQCIFCVCQGRYRNYYLVSVYKHGTCKGCVEALAGRLLVRSRHDTWYVWTSRYSTSWYEIALCTFCVCACLLFTLNDVSSTLSTCMCHTRISCTELIQLLLLWCCMYVYVRRIIGWLIRIYMHICDVYNCGFAYPDIYILTCIART